MIQSIEREIWERDLGEDTEISNPERRRELRMKTQEMKEK